MMFYLMIVVFIIGYACIALEHPLKINKSATALLLGATLWVLFVLGDVSTMPAYTAFQEYLANHTGDTFSSWIAKEPLLEHLGGISEILFFLLGAMTIVELVDTFDGFKIITDKITTRKKTSLLWIIGLITFFMSAVLDNLTTSIVMVALLRKLIADKKDRWMFASVVILAANSGGAWSPIGDVTTIMLWIKGKISALHVIETTFLASLTSMLVPLSILSFMLKGNIERPKEGVLHKKKEEILLWKRNLIFALGVGSLLFVPVFKTITGLPPYLGILGGLGILWVVTELLNKNHPERDKSPFSITMILQRIDISSILFFLGILMAVAALDTCGHLMMLSTSLESIPLDDPGKYYLITSMIGLFSSIVDNVPLVAGAIGMYNFPMDHYFWAFLAYAAGTGGSILIIGSAAGVAVMGMEKIDFIWYLKRVSLLALIGYICGCAVYILQEMIMAA